jgi:hypothetical protein
LVRISAARSWGRLGALVGDELAELGLLLVADRLPSETGAWAERLIESTSSGSMPVTSAISSAVGSRRAR